MHVVDGGPTVWQSPTLRHTGRGADIHLPPIRSPWLESSSFLFHFDPGFVPLWWRLRAQSDEVENLPFEDCRHNATKVVVYGGGVFVGRLGVQAWSVE